jgi:mRNA interferase MazF
MERFVKGNIVVIDFPFTSGETKKRPAIVIVNLEGEDIILCQITSSKRKNSILINNTDFEFGKIKNNSFVRIEKIFTLSKEKILYIVGKLKKEKIIEIENQLINLIKN